MSAAIGSFVKRRAHRRVFRVAVAVTLSTVVVKAVGLVKEVVVAGVYGRSDELEAFLTAVLVAGLLINIVSESMNQALIPTLVRVREQDGRGRAQRLLSNAMFWNGSLLLAVSAGMALLAHLFFPLVGSHFVAAKLMLAIRLFYGLMPVVVLTGFASTYTAVLSTEGEFAVPAVAPAVTPLLFMVLVPLLAGRAGAWAMVYAMGTGALIQAGWMAWKMSRCGYNAGPRWCGMNEETREVAGQFGPVMLSGVVASGGLLVDQAMAASLPAGSLAALAYAGRFVSVALALLGGAVSAALTPVFSEMVARGEWRECRRTVRLWAWGALAVATAVAGALIAGSRMLVGMTLQHGAFGARDSAAVSGVLVMYALQIPFFVSSRVFYRLLVAARRTDVVLYCGVLNLALDVALNLVLMRWMGVAGIALATSLWTVSTFIFLWYWSRRVLAEASGSGGGARVAGSRQAGGNRASHIGR
jgi:putative peptidoglycan lipid II flippase